MEYQLTQLWILIVEGNLERMAESSNTTGNRPPHFHVVGWAVNILVGAYGFQSK
jgi:hypothetical protein